MDAEIAQLSLSECLRSVKLQAREGISRVERDYGLRLASLIGDGLYQFVKFLGAGGESVVFAAFSLERRQTVAVKVALPYINAPGRRNISIFRGLRREKVVKIEEENTFKRRFLRGIDLQKSLGPLVPPKLGKIPKILRDPPLEGPIFIEMEMIHGEPLIEFCKGLHHPQKIEVFCRMLLLVEEIHSYRIIHRDLKSYNWMIEQGRPVLLDFGLAKEIQCDEVDQITVSRIGLGTGHYVSPEQLSDAGVVDYSADVFTMGEVLFDLVTGRYPDQPRPRIDSFDRELQQIYGKATHVNKIKRYHTARELFLDAEKYLAGLGRPSRRAVSVDIESLLSAVEDGEIIYLWYKAIKGARS